MLKHISINNYILIDKLDLDFGEGFSVITGETGAGKSILVGALSLILGKRADTDVLLDKEIKCVIEGTFDTRGLGLQTYFAEHDLDYEEDTVLRREINKHGKSRAFINDSPVNLPVLKLLGERLVDIHSQHQTLMLNESGFQMSVLDNYAGNAKLLEDYGISLLNYNQINLRLEELLAEEDRMRSDEDYLKFQYEEISAAVLQAGELQELEAEIKLLSNAEEIKGTLFNITRNLAVSDENTMDRLRDVLGQLGRISGFQQDIAAYEGRLDSLMIELKDIADGLADIEAKVQYDPQRLEEVSNRIDLIHTLLQKHKINEIEDLLEVHRKIGEKLSGISSLDADILKLKTDSTKAEVEVSKLADQLSRKRKKAISSVENEIRETLKRLGMEEGVFRINIEPLENFTPKGKDIVTFTFSANRGSSPAAVSKIASGGELSRLMLAIKSMITTKSLMPTIILDEIDMGVSGDIAGKVGSVLESISGKLQLVAITHLPQIAAKADEHFKVYKKLADNRTVSEVKCLSDSERIDEIAGMLSDESVSSAAKQTAKELLGI